MAEDKKIVQNLFDKHIKGTAEKAVVEDITIFLCHLTSAVAKGNKFPSNTYLNTRVLKHIYDKKPAEEFDCIICNLYHIVRYPDNIYKNKNPKRGHYVFTKKIGDENYLCSLEHCFLKEGNGKFEVVTAFRIRKGKEGYLKSYDLLWSWRDGIPSS